MPRILPWARIAYLAALVLVLLAASPADWVPAPLLKIFLFCALLAISAILFALSGGLRSLLRNPGRTGALAILLIPAAYFLSWLASANRFLGIIGVGNEVDTVFFSVIAAVAFLLGFGLFRNSKHASQLMRVLGWTIALGALFQFVSIFLGSHVLPSAFSDKSANLIGKWNDFGILMSVGLALVLARLELGEDEGYRRYLLIAALILLGLLLVLVQFNFIWWFTIGGVIVIGLLKWLPQLHEAGGASVPFRASRVPWFAGAALIVSILSLAFGSSITSRLPNVLSVPSLEVRPALSTTYDMAGASHHGARQTLLGTGPNTFVNDWIVNKPTSVNQTPFWSIDFAVGFSVLMTALVSVGIIGFLAWLTPVALVLIALWRLRLVRRMPTHERLSLISLGLVSAFLWAAVVLYSGSQDMVLIAFAAAGALWSVTASLYRPAQVVEPSAKESRLSMAGALLAAIVLLIAAVWPAQSFARQFLSYAYEQHAAQVLNRGDIIGAAGLDDSSQRLKQTGDNLRLGMSIDYAKMQKLAQASTTPDTINAMRQQFQNALQAAILQGRQATIINPHDYQAYALLGQVYEFLVPLHVQGAYESGQAAYKAAMKENPKNPTLPLLLARLEATQDLKGNLTDIQNLLNQSLSLKSNYTDAFLFAEQLAVSQNDLPTATKAAAAAVQTNPQNPAYWFQLGLLFYAGQDWADAIKALQNAVSLVPNYANAKYFLGLAEYKTGNTQDAMKQFSDLSSSNPDNAEVKLVLSNMQAGKDPFANEQPPQPPPQKRTKAPVKE